MRKIINLMWMFITGYIILIPTVFAQSSLEIRILNLETMLKQQIQKNMILEQRIRIIENAILFLKKEIKNSNILEIKTELLKEIEALSNQILVLSAKVEDLEFRYDNLDSSFNKSLKEINKQLKTISLKLELLEKKLKVLEPNVSFLNINLLNNQTQKLNKTYSFQVNFQKQKNQTLESQISLNNQTNKTKTILTNNQTLASNQTMFNQTVASQPTKVSNQTFTKEEIAAFTPKLLKFKEDTLYQEAYNLFKNKEYKKALELFEKYLQEFPKGKYVGYVYFWMGECYFNQEKYEDAILTYQKLLELPGWHPQKPTAIFRQAESFKQLGDKETYIILLKKLIRQYPTSKEAKEAKKLLNL